MDKLQQNEEKKTYVCIEEKITNLHGKYISSKLKSLPMNESEIPNYWTIPIYVLAQALSVSAKIHFRSFWQPNSWRLSPILHKASEKKKKKQPYLAIVNCLDS